MLSKSHFPEKALAASLVSIAMVGGFFALTIKAPQKNECPADVKNHFSQAVIDSETGKAYSLDKEWLDVKDQDGTPCRIQLRP